MVLATQHFIGNFRRLSSQLIGRIFHITDHDHLTFGHHLAILGAGIVGGPLPTPTQRLYLEHIHPIGQLHQALRPGEELGAEVGEYAKGEDIDLKVVDDFGKSTWSLL